MNTVAIVGVGLIGGSFALALRKAGFTGRILGVSSPASLAKALNGGVVDEPADLETAARLADLVYLSQPISGILATLDRLPGLIKADTLVTDAGSTKVEIVKRATARLPAGCFLGGHPVAGKETRGVERADPGIFPGRPYIITPVNKPTEYTPQQREFVSWLEKFEVVTVVLSPAEHDRTLAFVSHLPQLLSTALGSVISQEFGGLADTIPSGQGLADMVRLALSPYEIWQDILATNDCEIRHALEVYIDKLTDFRDNLTTSTLGNEFEVAARVAARTRQKL